MKKAVQHSWSQAEWVGCETFLDGWEKFKNFLDDTLLKFPCSSSITTLSCQSEEAREVTLCPAGFWPSGWSLWTQLQPCILVNGLAGDTLSTVYQHHWSSSSRKCCAVGKERHLASPLHKRFWLTQRDVWLFNMSRLIKGNGWWKRRGRALW